MFRSLLFLLPLIALLGEGHSASALARSSFMALHPRLIASPPIARRPVTRIVMPWRVRRWAALR